MGEFKFFFDTKLEKAIYDHINSTKYDIFKFAYDETSMWVKKGRATSSNLLHILTYKGLKNPILIPVERKSKKQTTLFETTKLIRLKGLNINVPDVIGVNSDFFAIEDCGSSIYSLIEKNKISNIEEVLEDVVRQLAKLHNLNEYHGGSQIKNFTIKDGIIYFIDFEESFESSANIKSLQFRDLFLFLFSISRSKLNVDYNKLVDLYIELTKNNDFKQKFKDLINSINFIMRLLEKKFIWNLVDKDTKSVYRLFQTLQRS